MKAKFIAVAIAALSLSVFADDLPHYLCWMVDLQPTEAEYTFAFASVKADGDLLTNYKGGESTQYIGPVGGGSGMETDSYYAYDIAEYVGSTFLFELYNDQAELVAWKSVSAADLAAHMGSTQSTVNPYRVSNVVPEPTGGLLVLFGLAGLALRRRARA